ncbi:MAG: hypothetical protein L6Q92_03675 [Phycisphaerae bacterium]|nr:hypothetical protein [Phycisphaerae bacterium]
MHARVHFASLRIFGIRLIVLTVVACLPDAAAARNTYRAAFFTEYPGAVGTPIDTVPSRPGHCGVCHYDFNGGGSRNPYGVRVGQVIGSYPNNLDGRRAAIRSIQNEDSDADGYTTLTEVTDTTNYSNTPTFPGLTPSNVGSVSNVTVSEIQPYLVPVLAPDITPPVVTVLSPNGGETGTGNASMLVQWTATDTGGIASIDLLLSDNNGATYRPLFLSLPHTGSKTIFLPNRPTTTALVRVRARDNAGNVGQDSSNAVFTVIAPAGGIAPTTLRDFDLPGSQPFEGGTVDDPFTCTGCHADYDWNVEPYFNWQGSMMAHASRDPLFLACMTIANQDAPDSGDVCLRCHIPNGWLRGRSVPTDGSQMAMGDKHGVSCSLCHRLVDPISDPENPAEDVAILAALTMPPNTFGNGMFVADPSGTRRGPFADAGSAHTILYSPIHRDAAFCGTCHDVSNPAFSKDGSGAYPPNAFDTPPADTSAHVLMPIERTYSEWFYSDYNTPTGVFAPEFGGNRAYVSVCQDCHMQAVTGYGCNLGEAPLRTLLPLHDMTGGSTWLPGLLDDLYPGEVDPVPLAAGILRAQYKLQNAATLAAVQQSAQLKVTVTNEAGHKLPTGYPEGRRVWINVRFFDASSTLLSESGAYDIATGVLTHDPEVKIYEAKPGLDTDTASLVGVQPGPSFHFVLNNKIYKDNRIPPRGFTNANYALFGGAPVGASYADGQHWDDSFYTIPPAAVSAEVRVYYQSTSKDYIEFLRDENTTDTTGDVMYQLWADNGRCPPELMAMSTVPLTPILVPGDIDGDGDVDANDWALFVGVLVGTETNPDYVMRSDLNDDEAPNGLDIRPFVAALIGP